MGRKNSKHVVNLYSGNTHHFLTVSSGQLDRLISAWKTQDEIRLEFRENNSSFNFRLGRFDAFTHAPVVEDEE